MGGAVAVAALPQVCGCAGWLPCVCKSVGEGERRGGRGLGWLLGSLALGEAEGGESGEEVVWLGCGLGSGHPIVIPAPAHACTMQPTPAAPPPPPCRIAKRAQQLQARLDAVLGALRGAGPEHEDDVQELEAARELLDKVGCGAALACGVDRG